MPQILFLYAVEVPDERVKGPRHDYTRQGVYDVLGAGTRAWHPLFISAVDLCTNVNLSCPSQISVFGLVEVTLRQTKSLSTLRTYYYYIVEWYLLTLDA